MKVLLIILGVLVVISVVGFVVKTLFWVGVIAAAAFVGVALWGAAKKSLGSDASSRQLGR